MEFGFCIHKHAGIDSGVNDLNLDPVLKNPIDNKGTRPATCWRRNRWISMGGTAYLEHLTSNNIYLSKCITILLSSNFRRFGARSPRNAVPLNLDTMEMPNRSTSCVPKLCHG
jgi:hypothetical protein